MPLSTGVRAGRPSPAPGQTVVTYAQASAAAAIAALSGMAGHLAEGLANVWNLTDPEAVILAGGVVQDNPIFVAALEAALQQVLPFATLRQPRLVVSPTSLYSGVQGAAVLAEDAEGRAGNEVTLVVLPCAAYATLTARRPGGEIGRRTGLKILSAARHVPVRVRPRARGTR